MVWFGVEQEEDEEGNLTEIEFLPFLHRLLLSSHFVCSFALGPSSVGVSGLINFTWK